MSELEIPNSAQSSDVGLTFVRPLPQGGTRAPSDAEGSSSHSVTLTLADRLFPPRSLEESGNLPPVTGLELGHFVIEERIGRGGMGAVFRAMDKRLGRVVAIKVLNVEHSSDPEAVLRFQNEARAAARLDHENIARVYYIGEEHGLHFIAFEFVTGTNVRNFILQKGHLSQAEAINYTLQIAEALRHTNAANVVHRDIKPSNIIVSPSGRAKLVDLGLARQSHSEMSRELTTVGTALGTFDYISPEQAIDARNVDVRSDIYSLGCTLYHMLTGSPPYPTGTMFEKVMNHHRSVPPDPAEKNRQISPQLARVVQKMMAANPDERYATPESLISDLLLIADSLGLEPTPPDAMVWRVPLFDRQAPRWNGARTWSAVALILLLVVLVDRLRSLSLPTSRLTAQQNQLSETPVKLGTGTVSSTANPPNATEPHGSFNTPGEAVADGEFPQLKLDLRTAEEKLSSLKPNSQMSTVPIITSLPKQSNRPQPSDPEDLNDDPESVPPASVPVTSQEPSKPISTASSTAMQKDAFYVVQPGSSERIARSTFASACAFAKDGGTIEVQPGGPIFELQETIRLTDKQIKIRPTQDYQPGKDPRPRLRIDLSSQLSLGSLSRSAELFEINRGAVEISEIDIEMVVDPSAISDWSIATLVNGSQLRANGVSVTMINPGNSRAALISIPATESAEIGELMPERMQPRANSIEFKDCICRGQFDFLVQQDSTPLNVSLQNCALAMTGCLVRVDGSETIVMGMDAEERWVTEISLDQVTLVAARGLLNANSGDHGSIPQLVIDLNNSVIKVDQLQQPLVEITGHEDYELLREKIAFREGRDSSYLQISGPFSLIDSATSHLPGRGRELDADQLDAGNLHVAQSDLVPLSTSLPSEDWHQITAADLDLSPLDDNPALGAGKDQQNAGVNWRSRLLPLPLPANSQLSDSVR